MRIRDHEVVGLVPTPEFAAFFRVAGCEEVDEGAGGEAAGHDDSPDTQGCSSKTLSGGSDGGRVRGFDTARQHLSRLLPRACASPHYAYADSTPEASSALSAPLARDRPARPARESARPGSRVRRQPRDDPGDRASGHSWQVGRTGSGLNRPEQLAPMLEGLPVHAYAKGRIGFQCCDLVHAA